MDQKVLEQKSEIMVLNAKLEALRKDNKKIVDIHSKYKSENSDSLNQKIVQQKSEIMMLNTMAKRIEKEREILFNTLSRSESKSSESLDQNMIQQKSQIVMQSPELKTLNEDEQLVDTGSKYKSQVKETISVSVQTDEVCMHLLL